MRRRAGCGPPFWALPAICTALCSLSTASTSRFRVERPWWLRWVELPARAQYRPTRDLLPSYSNQSLLTAVEGRAIVRVRAGLAGPRGGANSDAGTCAGRRGRGQAAGAGKWRMASKRERKQDFVEEVQRRIPGAGRIEELNKTFDMLDACYEAVGKEGWDELRRRFRRAARTEFVSKVSGADGAVTEQGADAARDRPCS